MDQRDKGHHILVFWQYELLNISTFELCIRPITSTVQGSSSTCSPYPPPSAIFPMTTASGWLKACLSTCRRLYYSLLRLTCTLYVSLLTWRYYTGMHWCMSGWLQNQPNCSSHVTETVSLFLLPFASRYNCTITTTASPPDEVVPNTAAKPGM